MNEKETVEALDDAVRSIVERIASLSFIAKGQERDELVEELCAAIEELDNGGAHAVAELLLDLVQGATG